MHLDPPLHRYRKAQRRKILGFEESWDVLLKRSHIAQNPIDVFEQVNMSLNSSERESARVVQCKGARLSHAIVGFVWGPKNVESQISPELTRMTIVWQFIMK